MSNISDKLLEEFNIFSSSLIERGFLTEECTNILLLEDENDSQYLELIKQGIRVIFDNLERSLKEENVNWLMVHRDIIDVKGRSYSLWPVGPLLHQLHSIGANEVTNACVAFVQHAESKNITKCLEALSLIKGKQELVEDILRTLIRMKKLVIGNGGSISKASVVKKIEIDHEWNQYFNLIKHLLNKGILNNQYIRLQLLQSQGKPGLVNKLVTNFFEDTERQLHELDKILAPGFSTVDYPMQMLDISLHALMDNSSR